MKSSRRPAGSVMVNVAASAAAPRLRTYAPYAATRPVPKNAVLSSPLCAGIAKDRSGCISATGSDETEPGVPCRLNVSVPTADAFGWALVGRACW